MIDDERRFREDGRRPGDERGFFHKKILGFVGGLGIPGISTVANIAGSLVGGGQAIPKSREQVVDLGNVVPGKWPPSQTTWAPGARPANGPCRPPLFMNDRGQCVSPATPFGSRTLGGGTVLEGRYGPGYVPTEVMRSIAICPTGSALGKDGLCYDHLPNRDRKYPRGRRPLLTGGDMRSISRARRAGNRLANAKSDLIAIGMLKPAARKRRKKASVPCA